MAATTPIQLLPAKMKSFAIEFACEVTVASDDMNDMVARNGHESIFALLIRFISQVDT